VLQKRQERFQVKYNLELEMKWEVIELRWIPPKEGDDVKDPNGAPEDNEEYSETMECVEECSGLICHNC
jgi:hypothetical protein